MPPKKLLKFRRYRGKLTKAGMRLYRSTALSTRRGMMPTSFLNFKRPHSFRVTAYTQNLVPSTIDTGTVTLPIQGALSFKLSDIPNSSEFIALYDQYMITKVVVSFIPQNTGVFAPAIGDDSAATNFIPSTGMIHSALDFNDATAVNLQNLLQYQTYKSTRGSRVHTRTIYKPKYILTNSGATTAQAQAVASRWQATSQYDVVHYGLKYVINPQGIANVPSSTNIYVSPIDLKVEFHFLCKNVI